MTAIHIIFPTVGDVVAAVVIIAFWAVLAYFAVTGVSEEGDGE